MRAILLVLLVALPVLAFSCFTKDAGFFPTANTIVDEDGPVFQDYSPAANLPGPFNINTFRFRVADLAGANGATPSGVDVNSIQVLLGPTPMSTTRSGDNYTVDLTGITDGPVVLNLGARDHFGNSSSGIVNFILKRTPPRISFTDTPQSNWQSNRSMETLSYSGTIMDPFLRVAIGSLYRAGSDGQCRADDALLWPVGNESPGTVSQNTFNYGLSGQFQLHVNAWNGVLPGEPPKIGRYCLGITAEAFSTTETGASSPISATLFHASNLEWSSVPQVHSVVVTPGNVSVTHPTTQQMTATVTADPGVSTSVSWSATSATVGTIDQNGLVTTVGPGQLDVEACSTIAPTVCGTARMTVLSAPFDFMVSWPLVSWNHMPYQGGPSNNCGRGKAVVTQGTHTLVGSPYTVTWTGPGIVGSGTRNGTLDANGEFFDRQPIASFGTYNVRVDITIDGLTRSATGTTTVNSGTGQCPPP